MGFVDQKISWGFRSLMRRKQVDNSAHGRSQEDSQQLAKELSVLQLIAIGIFLIPLMYTWDFVGGVFPISCFLGFSFLVFFLKYFSSGFHF